MRVGRDLNILKRALEFRGTRFGKHWSGGPAVTISPVASLRRSVAVWIALGRTRKCKKLFGAYNIYTGITAKCGHLSDAEPLKSGGWGSSRKYCTARMRGFRYGFLPAVEDAKLCNGTRIGKSAVKRCQNTFEYFIRYRNIYFFFVSLAPSSLAVGGVYPLARSGKSESRCRGRSFSLRCNIAEGDNNARHTKG